MHALDHHRVRLKRSEIDALLEHDNIVVLDVLRSVIAQEGRLARLGRLGAEGRCRREGGEEEGERARGEGEAHGGPVPRGGQV